MDVCLACSESSREAQAGEGNQVRDQNMGPDPSGALVRTLASPLSEMESQEGSKQGRNRN